MEKYTEVIQKMKLWLEYPALDPQLRKELISLDKKINEKTNCKAALEEVYERFYKELEFGTGGLRGILGAGTNRINEYTVSRVTQGLADYINRKTYIGARPKAAISYDSRIYSKEFAEKAAQVLSANYIDVYLYKELMPTPALSFAVRYFGCAAGIMITASHNPAMYNGYKAYNHKGCQLNLQETEVLISLINEIDLFHGVRCLTGPFQERKETAKTGRIKYISEDVITEYIETVKKERTGVDCSDLSVVYTPLNGTGNKPVRRILKEIGVREVEVVPEQENPDGRFPTCPYPNPEKVEALKLGLALCEKRCKEATAMAVGPGAITRGMMKKPDLLLATDPDSDRVAIAVRVQGVLGEDTFRLLSGNEMGILLLDFLCQMRSGSKKQVVPRPMPKKPIAIKTIVSSKMIEILAKHYGVELIQVLTGFKFIGEQIGFLEDKGEEDRFIFGYEESYGYLAGSYVRDKDAVNGSMLLCEMTAYYKKQGKTLVNRLEELYHQFGYYKNELLDFTFEGAYCMQEMQRLLDGLRSNPPASIAGSPVSALIDYANDETELPKANVLQFNLQDESRFIVRPSGTEPKLKIYFFVQGSNKSQVDNRMEALKAEVSKLVDTNC
ncbi:MAG: phospho-sugar mutase [Anaerovorax sp.]|nr:phospho-sugar mutase [Anaerovorax sp.]